MMIKTNEPFSLIINDPVELTMASLKSKLIITITQLIRQEGWTQVVAAKRLGVSQPRVSNLLHGYVSKFSIDMLLEMLCKIGFVVDVTFRPHKTESPIEMTIKKAVV
ncbi:XRE family transcriptional regulator [Enterobacter roggenkampii]|nr:XRE family transcriptional regulator [Enterobacter roggenkampii]